MYVYQCVCGLCNLILIIALCANCFQTQQKALCTLPYVLSLNCQLETEQDREFWKFQQAGQDNGAWVPLSMEVTVSEDKTLNIVEHHRNAGASSQGQSTTSSQKVCVEEMHRTYMCAPKGAFYMYIESVV